MDNSGTMEQQFQVPEGNIGFVAALELLLKEVLLHIQPSDEDYQKRMNLITRITTVLQGLEHLKGASIKPFGSFLSNLYTRWGDLDITIEIPANGRQSSEVGKNKKKKILSSIRQTLLGRGVTRSVQFIATARVPLLIFEDPQSQISCDVSINNGAGVLKSKFFSWISEIDTRFRDLIFLIKYWAKAHNINDPKTGTLNSFSLSLLVVFHLQTRSPPILPPFKDIYDAEFASNLAGRTGTDEIQIEDKCIQNVLKFMQQGFGRENKSTISELFVSFFAQYASVASLWLEGLTVCAFTGKWGNTSSIACQIKKQYAMIIEDPFDHRENCARSVTESTLRIISDEIVKTHQSLQNLPGFIEMHLLRQSLFGSPYGMPRPYVLPSQQKIVNTSRKFEENNANKTGFLRVSEVTHNPIIQIRPQPLAYKYVDSVPAAFGRGCSLDERSMPCQQNVISTSHSVYRQQAQPSFPYYPSQHHCHALERKQQPISSRTDIRIPTQNGKIWKPKSDSRGFNC